MDNILKIYQKYSKNLKNRLLPHSAILWRRGAAPNRKGVRLFDRGAAPNRKGVRLFAGGARLIVESCASEAFLTAYYIFKTPKY